MRIPGWFYLLTKRNNSRKKFWKSCACSPISRHRCTSCCRLCCVDSQNSTTCCRGRAPSPVASANRFACRTAPFTAEQTSEYVSQRLRSAGARDSSLFDPEAVRLIHQYAGGIPRVINALCDQLLIEAYCDGRPSVCIDIVRKVAIERESGPSKSWPGKNALECTVHDAI